MPQDSHTHSTYAGNDLSQVLLGCGGCFAFALLMYFSGGNHMLNEANAKRDLLRSLRDHGVTAQAAVRTEYHGKPYLDMNHGFRAMRDFNDYVVFEVDGKSFEMRQDLGLAVGGGDDKALKVRYLPADPEQFAYSSDTDILHSMQADIRGHTMTLLFVWAVVLAPAAFGSLIALCSIRPDIGAAAADLSVRWPEMYFRTLHDSVFATKRERPILQRPQSPGCLVGSTRVILSS